MSARPRVLLAVAFLAASVLTISCGEADEDTIPGPNMLDEVETEVVETIEIDAGGNFSSEVVEAEPGQAIELTNISPDPQRVRGTLEDDLVYDTGNLFEDETTLIAFESVGRYTFEVDDAANDPEPLRVTVSIAD